MNDYNILHTLIESKHSLMKISYGIYIFPFIARARKIIEISNIYTYISITFIRYTFITFIPFYILIEK